MKLIENVAAPLDAGKLETGLANLFTALGLTDRGQVDVERLSVSPFVSYPTSSASYASMAHHAPSNSLYVGGHQVRRHTRNPDGTLSAASSILVTLPGSNEHSYAVVGNYLVVFRRNLEECYTVPINPDGTLGAVVTTALPRKYRRVWVQHGFGWAVVVDGGLFKLTFTDGVPVAAAELALPVAKQIGNALLANSKRLYYFGVNAESVVSCALNPDGTTGPWLQETKLATWLSGSTASLNYIQASSYNTFGLNAVAGESFISVGTHYYGAGNSASNGYLVELDADGRFKYARALNSGLFGTQVAFDRLAIAGEHYFYNTSTAIGRRSQFWTPSGAVRLWERDLGGDRRMVVGYTVAGTTLTFYTGYYQGASLRYVTTFTNIVLTAATPLSVYGFGGGDFTALAFKHGSANLPLLMLGALYPHEVAGVPLYPQDDGRWPRWGVAFLFASPNNYVANGEGSNPQFALDLLATPYGPAGRFFGLYSPTPLSPSNAAGLTLQHTPRIGLPNALLPETHLLGSGNFPATVALVGQANRALNITANLLKEDMWFWPRGTFSAGLKALPYNTPSALYDTVTVEGVEHTLVARVNRGAGYLDVLVATQ